MSINNIVELNNYLSSHNIEESFDMKEINEIDNCLFCLFYYSD